jgi:hypothetical protein
VGVPYQPQRRVTIEIIAIIITTIIISQTLVEIPDIIEKDEI